MDVDGYSARAEAFATELARRYHRQFAGLGSAEPLGALYDAHRELFTAHSVQRLRAARAVADGEMRRRLAALLRFAVDGHLGQAAAPLEAELARREAAARVADVRLGEVARLQAYEPDAGRRAALEAERCQVIERSLAPLAGEVVELSHARARALGWPSYAAMYGDLGDLDLAALAGQARRFLAATDAGFSSVVAGPVRCALGLSLGELARSDLPRLLRAPWLDGHFPADGLAAGLTQTLADLGVDLAAQVNIVLDLEPRAGKSRRPFCSPVRVPEEVYLVLAADGGWDDYAALLHEAGHAEHFAAADPALPFELRRRSDPAVGEGFAFLLERISDDPAWLADRGLGPEVGDIARARRLLLLRRYAAKLEYELELHGGEIAVADAAPVYAARLSAGLGVPWPRATWLTDLDPGLYVAHYLRAWALAERMRGVLVEGFGAAWFRSAAAGEVLRGWWRESHGLRAEELLARVGGGGLDFAELAGEFGGGGGGDPGHR